MYSKFYELCITRQKVNVAQSRPYSMSCCCNQHDMCSTISDAPLATACVRIVNAIFGLWMRFVRLMRSCAIARNPDATQNGTSVLVCVEWTVRCLWNGTDILRSRLNRLNCMHLCHTSWKMHALCTRTQIGALHNAIWAIHVISGAWPI